MNAFFSQERDKVLCYLGKTFHFSREDSEDIYQDACFALYQNIERNRLEELTSSLLTYFVQICRNLANKRIRDNKETVRMDELLPVLTEEGCRVDKLDELTQLCLEEDDPVEEYLACMEQLVKQLPSPCEEILWGFYRDRFSMKELADMLKYKNEQVVKVTKVRCIDKLKNKFHEWIAK